MKFLGLDVFDANRPARLHITARDCLTGQRDPAGCAAAKAACRIPGVLEARIYRSRSYLLHRRRDGTKYWERFQTPGALRSEMIAIDRGGRFEPDDYELKCVSKRDRIGADYSRDQRKRHDQGKGKKPYREHKIVKNIRPVGPQGRNRTDV